MKAIQKSSPEDLRKILREQGYSLVGWARANGYSRITVTRALSGRHLGKRGREIRAKVEGLTK